jgi:hypothetical protein
MELQGDVGQIEAQFGPFGDSVNLHTRLVHDLCQTCNRLENYFGHTRWDFKVTWVKWKHILVLFRDSVNIHTRLVHDLRQTCNRLRNSFWHTRWNS